MQPGFGWKVRCLGGIAALIRAVGAAAVAAAWRRMGLGGPIMSFAAAAPGAGSPPAKIPDRQKIQSA